MSPERKRILEIEEELRKLVQEQLQLQVAVDEREFGIKIGQRIEYEGYTVEITRFSHFWPYGMVVKKDGLKGLNGKHLFNIKRKDDKE